jgi:hypothetical protein
VGEVSQLFILGRDYDDDDEKEILLLAVFTVS